MNAPQRLVLKQSTGWFAAGWEFGEAMLVLSDAAFKLFVWVCLNADRHTGQLRVPFSEISRVLRKPEAWTKAALTELNDGGVLEWLEDVVEVSDGYWPYQKQVSGTGSEEYVARVRKMLSAPACVRCRFTVADEKL